MKLKVAGFAVAERAEDEAELELEGLRTTPTMTKLKTAQKKWKLVMKTNSPKKKSCAMTTTKTEKKTATVGTKMQAELQKCAGVFHSQTRPPLVAELRCCRGAIQWPRKTKDQPSWPPRPRKQMLHLPP